MSLSARRAWIEIPAGCWRESRRASLSARRAWIEIPICFGSLAGPSVALRKESVDRNFLSRGDVLCLTVALRKESVDRNTKSPLKDNTTDRSLSARRAWIEMDMRSFGGADCSGRSPQGERG